MMKNYKLLDINSHNKYGFFCDSGEYLVQVDFDPWSGKLMLTGYEGACAWIEGNYPDVSRLGKEAIQDAIRKHFETRRRMHKDSSVCDFLYDTTCGYDKGTTRADYISNIRAYVFFRKDEKGVFDAMDYCPFCGAKLPERLDEKLTDLLQKEYGLNSWKDYKKAPHEFHTDEWWKKRGL
jgi:hypothetical protein